MARNENQQARFISLDLEQSTAPDLIAKRGFQALKLASVEEEFSGGKGVMHITCVEENTALNKKLRGQRARFRALWRQISTISPVSEKST